MAVITALVVGTLAGAAPKVSVTPASLVLGRDAEAQILVVAQGSGRLRAVANVGRLEATGAPAPDQTQFRFSPPGTKAPQMAVLLFWLEDGNRPDVAVVRVPLLGRTDLDATTEPGATVRVEVAQALFGPVKADSKGRVVVPIEVPPEVTQATVLAELRGQATRRQVPLDVPRSNPLAAVLSPDPLPGDGSGWLVVAHAEELDVGALEFRLEGARLERAYAGTDRAQYQVFPEAGAERVTVKVTLKNQPEANAWAVAGVETLELLPAPPAAESRRPEVSLTAGYFYSGGANAGPSLSLGAGYPLPGAMNRLTLEAAAGVRASSLRTSTALGNLDSAILMVPLDVILRVTVLERGPAKLFGRAAVGLVPFRHAATPPVGSSFVETGLGFEGFAAVQGAYLLGPVELFGEVRGTIAPMRTARLDAEAGGVSGHLGVRVPLP